MAQYKQNINFYLMANRFFEEYAFRKLSWKFFEAGHGKKTAHGVGGTMKRQVDATVAKGKDIADAFQVFSTRQYTSKMFMVTDEVVENVAATIPTNIMPLKGTMQVNQMFSETLGILSHRVLSYFCEQFCSCHVPKTYRPLPEIQPAVDQLSANEKEDDTINVFGTSFQTFQLKERHSTKIEDGAYVLAKVRIEKNVHYTYAGVAKSTVDEEGDVLVMFLKTVDDSGRLFKLVENDLSDGFD